MVDNVDFTPGSGGQLATDEIAGVHYPRTKIVIGDDSVNDGDISSANPLPVYGSINNLPGGLGPQVSADSLSVTIASDQTAIPVTGTFSGIPPLGQTDMTGSLPVTIASDQTAVPVTFSGGISVDDGGGSITIDATSLPLPTGAATEATLSTVNGKLPALVSTVPQNGVSAPPVRPVGQDIWTCSFAAVGSSVLSSDFTSPIVGTGVGYSQAAGSLLITTGTSTNAEFLTRSTTSWRGSMRMRASIVASQRIAQNNLQITLADLIGEGLSYSIVSSTVVGVTKTAHGFTAQNVGQFMFIGGITGAAGVPGRYAIASIPDANTIRFTVAGWPGSGSGTLTLFGWNHVKNLVQGTTATQLVWDAQRRGWATGDTTAAINTTAAPGTIIQNDLNGRDAFLMDSLRTSTLVPTFATRASRYENMPDDDVDLYVFIWSYNGTSAPASTTTWTLGFISVEKFANQPVYIQGARTNGAANALPVTVQGTATITGSVTNISAGANAIGDVGIQYRASATGAGTVTNVNSPATPVGQTIKGSAGRLLGFVLSNTNAAARYVKLFNATSVTPGTTSALTEFAIPAGQTIQFKVEGGMAFSTGIMIMITAAQGLTNNGAITGNEVNGFTVHA